MQNINVPTRCSISEMYYFRRWGYPKTNIKFVCQASSEIIITSDQCPDLATTLLVYPYPTIFHHVTLEIGPMMEACHQAR